MRAVTFGLVIDRGGEEVALEISAALYPANKNNDPSADIYPSLDGAPWQGKLSKEETESAIESAYFWASK